MHYVRRIIRFVYLHLHNNPRFLFRYALHFFDPAYVPKVMYFKTSDIESIVRAGKSIIRLGDGEIYIMNGGGIYYQKFEPRLQKILLDMIAEYTKESSYVLGLPDEMIKKTNIQLRKEKLLHCWLPMKVFFDMSFNKKAQYLDAFMFYYNETIPNYLETYLLQKQIVVVTNKNNIDAIKHNKNIPFTAIEYIETKALNAFEDYDRIKDLIRNTVDTFGKENVITLVSFGPASKAAAFELSQEGYVLIDIGRGIEISYTDERIDHLLRPR